MFETSSMFLNVLKNLRKFKGTTQMIRRKMTSLNFSSEGILRNTFVLEFRTYQTRVWRNLVFEKAVFLHFASDMRISRSLTFSAR